MNKTIWLGLALFLLLALYPGAADANQTGQVELAPSFSAGETAIPYRGQLQVSGEPANGWYDFQFTPYAGLEGGSPIAPARQVDDIYVMDGVFNLLLDFGDAPAVGSGYLEVGVRPTGSGAPYTTLSPREPVDFASTGGDAGLLAEAEQWSLGVTVEDDGLLAGYDAAVGRIARDVAAFRSYRGVSDIYFVFPAPATERTITAARYYIDERTGSYPDTAGMRLKIFDMAGNLMHVVSTGSVDMESAPVGTWRSISLSGTASNLIVSPGEYLAFHFELSGNPAGNLDVRPRFEIEVE